jgi:phosphatidate cytidylyltransferase
MTRNLKKRILTSIIVFPLSIFFIIKGGNFLLCFLLIVFFAANYELFSVFSKKTIILFLDLILIISLFSIYTLRHDSFYFNTPLNDQESFVLLMWIIILCICSDIGGYIFGKTFKWKKLTKISPNKTLSGVLGSFIFSLFSVFIVDFLVTPNTVYFLHVKFYFLAIIFSLIAQAGDLTISFFKRLEKIKDTGKILPGHGGIFDRIDGLMFVVIFTFILYKFNVIP